MSINLISSESDDEPTENVQNINHPCSRNGLYVARTKLYDVEGKRMDHNGLFTSQQIKKGDFILFYTGEFYTEDAYRKLRDVRLRNEYAISLENDIVVSPPLNGMRPDPTLHPGSMANEPSPGSHSNAILMEYDFTVDELSVPASDIDENIHSLDDDFQAVGLVSCRDIGKYREIVWSYGSSFPRPYSIGKPCKAPKRREIQDPLRVFGGSIPIEAVAYQIHIHRKRQRR